MGNVDLNCKLIGHKNEFFWLYSQFAGGSIHPCWIVRGIRGIGKATFAYHFAVKVLSCNPQNPEGLPKETVARQIQANIHPNFLTIQKTTGQKTTGEDCNRQEILLADIKKALLFLNKSPLLPGWRVLVIDAADELNRAAANCLLKVLEEPPEKTLILLICHNFGQVLPTLRSRCQRLDLMPLSFAEISRESIRNQTSPNICKQTFTYSQGSLGNYLNIQGAGGLEFVKTLEEMIESARQGKWIKLQKFCRETSQVEKQFNCLLWLLPCLIQQKCLAHCAVRAYPNQPPLNGEWLAIEQRLADFLARAKISHLDKNQLLVTCFLIIENPYLALDSSNNYYFANL